MTKYMKSFRQKDKREYIRVYSDRCASLYLPDQIA